MPVTAMTRIALIGGGKMGEAIVGGWIAAREAPAGILSSDNFVIANPGRERRVYLTQRYGVACVEDAGAIDAADVVVLAVKPQVMLSVLKDIAHLGAYAGGAQGPLFVSIAAGLSTERLESALPAHARLVRVMPNTPLLVGAGATTVAGGGSATHSDVELVRDLFACLGVAYVVDEDDMDAAGALSGSGPAYVAAMIEALRDAGVAQGLKADVAESLVQQTVYGTALLMRETGQDAQTTRVAVCSPGGSTLAALAAMHDAGLYHVFEAGVAAAVRRSKELGQC